MNRESGSRRGAGVVLALALVLAGGAARADVIYPIFVDTTSLSGTGWLAFNLNNPGSLVPGTLEIRNFSPQSALTGLAPVYYNSASGNLNSVGLVDYQPPFTNALLQEVTLGQKLFFDLVFKGDPFEDPNFEACSDFALYLLGGSDFESSPSLVTTTDPLGLDALMTANFGPCDPGLTFYPTNGGDPIAGLNIPEPGSLALVALAGVAGLVARRRRRAA